MADSFLFWLALATLASWLIGGFQVAVGSRKIPYLRDVAPRDSGVPDRVSIVVAARNEATTIEAAARSLLLQRGVELEVVFVNDRSEDATGSLLQGIASGDSRVSLHHVGELPPGWLGKNHALHTGAAHARGEWLLFTDADIVLGPDAAGRAVTYAREKGLDHVAVMPELRMPGALSDIFAGTFAFLFARFATPWRAPDPADRSHIGIGAFNLVRSDAYRSVGGHGRIALRPDDDMMLGKILKRGGFRQEGMYGRGEVQVEWYGSIGEAIRGLEKNAFAGLGYSVAVVISACSALIVTGVWPYAALFLTSGSVLAVNAATVAVMTVLYVASTRASASSPWYAPALPLGILFFCYAVVRSMTLALVRGEIRWRGTAYSLDELRRNRV
jgi:hypothetical protein